MTKLEILEWAASEMDSGNGCRAFYLNAYATGEYTSAFDGQLDRFARSGVADRLAGSPPNPPAYPIEN